MYCFECHTGFIARGAGREANTARGEAEVLNRTEMLPRVLYLPSSHAPSVINAVYMAREKAVH